MKYTIIFLLTAVLFPLSVCAQSAIECHCFQDRSYDMARPGAADDYYLTATQNTFFALTFDITKKTIVRKKQRGADSGELWVAYWLANKSGMEADVILSSRSQQPNWSATIEILNINTDDLGQTFNQALQDVNSPLDQVVVNDVVMQRQLLAVNDLNQLRDNNASNKEVLACALLAAKSDHHPLLFLQQVQDNIKNWDGLMTETGIDIQQIEQIWLTTFKSLKKG